MPKRSRTEPARQPARRPAEPLADEQYRLLADFRHALRRYLRFSEIAAKELGLTGQQYQALLVVRASAGPTGTTINSLAEQLLIKHNSAVGLVDRLVEQDLLTRTLSSHDRRKVELSLTSKGAQLLRGLADVHRSELERWAPELAELLRHISGGMGR
jgi:DNA-binding MarR family transcriptional regulator